MTSGFTSSVRPSQRGRCGLGLDTDIESTMRYLKPSRSQHVREKMTRSSADSVMLKTTPLLKGKRDGENVKG